MRAPRMMVTVLLGVLVASGVAVLRPSPALAGDATLTVTPTHGTSKTVITATYRAPATIIGCPGTSYAYFTLDGGIILGKALVVQDADQCTASARFTMPATAAPYPLSLGPHTIQTRADGSVPVLSTGYVVDPDPSPTAKAPPRATPRRTTPPPVPAGSSATPSPSPSSPAPASPSLSPSAAVLAAQPSAIAEGAIGYPTPSGGTGVGRWLLAGAGTAVLACLTVGAVMVLARRRNRVPPAAGA